MADNNLLEPHSTEAEEAVLGAILINPDVLDEVAFLRPNDFYIIRHGWIFEAITDLRKRRQPYDYLTICQELEEKGRLNEAGGMAYILNLTNKTPSSLNAEGYGQIVQRMAIRRRLLAAAGDIARAAHSEETDIDAVLAQAEQAVQEVSAVRASTTVDTVDSVGRRCLARLAAAEEMREQGETLTVKTGIDAVDYITDGQITFGRIVQILGASGHFKTTLACRMVPALATQAPVLYVSQEMPTEDVLDRIACQRAHVPSSSLIKGTLTDVEGERYRRAVIELMSMRRIEFLSRRTSVLHITNYVRGMMKRFPGQKVVIIIDTVNTLFGTNHQQGTTDGTVNVAAELEALKLETGALIIGLIQQYVASNEDRVKYLRPSQNNVMYSKALFQKCDLMWGTYYADHWRGQYPGFDDEKCPKGKLLVTMLKNRYGDASRAKLLEMAPGIPDICGETYQKDGLEDKAPPKPGEPDAKHRDGVVVTAGLHKQRRTA
jgi:replicative DNA helicase